MVVKLPPTLKSIEPLMFSGCERLEYLEFPTTVTNIGYEAFKGCLSLSHVRIPRSYKRQSLHTIFSSLPIAANCRGIPFELDPYDCLSLVHVADYDGHDCIETLTDNNVKVDSAAVCCHQQSLCISSATVNSWRHEIIANGIFDLSKIVLATSVLYCKRPVRTSLLKEPVLVLILEQHYAPAIEALNGFETELITGIANINLTICQRYRMPTELPSDDIQRAILPVTTIITCLC
eukprot:scaffold293_cov135-Cylindrotheca_fusiformis.AAC.2